MTLFSTIACVLCFTAIATIFYKPILAKRNNLTAARAKDGTGKQINGTMVAPTGQRAEEVWGRDPSVALRNLVSRLKGEIELESVVFTTWTNGEPLAILDFPGFVKAEQAAFEKANAASLEEQGQTFMEIIQVESSVKRVFVVHYKTKELAAIHVKPHMREIGMAWSSDCFYFQGDPEKIAAIRRCLGG